MKFRSSALALAACALVFTACGEDTGQSDKASEKSAATAPTLDEASGVVVDYFTLVFAADAGACDLETEKFAAAQNELLGVKTCTERIESLTEMIPEGEPYMDASKSVVTMSEGEDGIAVAEVEHEWDGFGATYHLVVRDGAWVFDAEAPMTPTGDGSTFTEPKAVSEEEALALAKGFCQVRTGATREQVEEWLGAPTAESVDDDGQTELGWYVNQDAYTVWLDDAGTVASSSGSSPREDDPCQG